MENPYVSLVAKRVRNLRKRLSKVEEYASRSEGKVLDAGVQAALDGRAALEAQLADMEGVLAQLQEVAKTAPVAATNGGRISDKELLAVAKAFSSMDMEVPQAPASKGKGKSKGKKTAESAMGASAVEAVGSATATTSTFSTPSVETATAAVGTPTTSTEEVAAEVEARVRNLLRALHVGARFVQETGKALPVELSYFTETTLGRTTTVGTSFSDALEQSVRQVGFFLFPETSANVTLLTGASYGSLQDTVHRLAADMGEKGNAAAAKGKRAGKKGKVENKDKDKVGPSVAKIVKRKQTGAEAETAAFAAVKPPAGADEPPTAAAPKKKAGKKNGAADATAEPLEVAVASFLDSKVNISPNLLTPVLEQSHEPVPKQKRSPRKKHAVTGQNAETDAAAATEPPVVARKPAVPVQPRSPGREKKARAANTSADAGTAAATPTDSTKPTVPRKPKQPKQHKQQQSAEVTATATATPSA